VRDRGEADSSIQQLPLYLWGGDFEDLGDEIAQVAAREPDKRRA